MPLHNNKELRKSHSGDEGILNKIMRDRQEGPYTMDVLFFNDNDGMVTEINGTSNYSELNDRVLPYSLLVGASLLRDSGFRTDFYDASVSNDTVPAALNRISEIRPKILVTTVNILSVFRTDPFFRELKQRLDVLIVVWFTDNFQNEFVDHLCHADILIQRDWFTTTLDLCMALVDGKEIVKVSGLMINRSGKTLHTGIAPHPPLETLPLPALDLADMTRYNHHQVLLTEGCNYGCLFCYFGKQVPGGWTCKPIEMCIKELRFLRNHGKRFIRIIDNELTLNPRNAKTLMRRIIEENLDIVWETNIRVSHMDEELIYLMAKAGCIQAGFGVESGVQEILDLNNKQITLEQVLRVSRWLRKHKIISRAYFLVGLKGDTKESIERTFDFITREVRADSASFDLVIPYPGTTYHDYLHSHGLLKKVRVEHIHWIYKNLYGYQFLDSSHSIKPDWRYEHLAFDEAVNLMERLYHRIPHSNQFAKLKRLCGRKLHILIFLFQQVALHPEGTWKRMKRATQ